MADNDTNDTRPSNIPQQQVKSKVSSLISKILDACGLHKAQHDSGKITQAATPSEKCCKELHTLRNVLPKIEETFFGTSTNNILVESDVVQMCRVYAWILENGFCPHAASLIFETTDTSDHDHNGIIDKNDSTTADNINTHISTLLRILKLLRLFLIDNLQLSSETCDTIASTVAQFVLHGDDEDVRQGYMRSFAECLQRLVCIQVVCSKQHIVDRFLDDGEITSFSIFDEVRRVIRIRGENSKSSHNISNTPNDIIFEVALNSFTTAKVRMLCYTIMTAMTNIMQSDQLWLANRQFLFRDGTSDTLAIQHLVAAIRSLLLYQYSLDEQEYYKNKKAACVLLEFLLDIIESEHPSIISTISTFLSQFLTQLMFVNTDEEMNELMLRLIHRTILCDKADSDQVLVILFDSIVIFHDALLDQRSINDNVVIMIFHTLSEYLTRILSDSLKSVVIDSQKYTTYIVSLLLHNIQHTLPVHTMITVLVQILSSDDNEADDILDTACCMVLKNDVVGTSSGFFMDTDTTNDADEDRKYIHLRRSGLEGNERSERRKKRRRSENVSVNNDSIRDSFEKGNEKSPLKLHKRIVEKNVPSSRSIGGKSYVSVRCNEHSISSLIRNLSKPIAFANQIINAEVSGNAAVLSLVNSSSCYSLSSALRLLLIYYREKSSLMNDFKSFLHVREMMQHLCQAVTIITKAISRACCDELPTNIGPKRIKKILASLLGVAFAVYDCNLKDETGDVLDQVVTCALSAWSSNSILIHQFNQTNSKSSASLDSLSTRVCDYSLKRQCRRCYSLGLIFGVKFDTHYPCWGSDYMGQCAECTLPLNARCLFLASLTSPEKVATFISSYSTNMNDSIPSFILASILALLPLVISNDHLIKSLLLPSFGHEDIVIRRSALMVASIIVSIPIPTNSNLYMNYITKRVPSNSILEYSNTSEKSPFVFDLVRSLFEIPTFSISSENSHLRLTKWYFIVDVVAQINFSKLKLIFPDSDQIRNQLMWAFRVPFVDEDPDIRRITSNYFGLMLLTNRSLMLKFLFFQDNNDGTERLDEELAFKQAWSKVVDEVGKSLSNILPNKAGGLIPIENAISTLKCFSNICLYANLEYSSDGIAHSFALVQLFRCWARKDTCVLNRGCGIHSQLSNLAFSEIYNLQIRRPLFQDISKSTELLSSIFSDIYIETPWRDNDVELDREFTLLYEFSRTFLIPQHYTRGPDEVLKVFEKILPMLLTTFILSEDLSNLLGCCSGYRIFLRQKANSNGSKLRYKSKTIVQRKRQEELCILCLDNMHKILPHLLLQGGKSCLVFLLTRVLVGQEQISLAKLVQHRELSVLKALISRVALDIKDDVNVDDQRIDTSDSILNSLTLSRYLNSKDGITALHKASLLRFQESLVDRSSRRNDEEEVAVYDFVLMEATPFEKTGYGMITKWVGRNFMFLLVNNVLDRLTESGKNDEKSTVIAMKSLLVLLHFVEPDSAPQYIPQVMAAVNAAIGDGSEDSDNLIVKKSRLLAIRALSKFVHILLSHQVSTVGSNLSTIIVSLFPVIVESSCGMTCIYTRKAMNEAIDLIENLVIDDNISSELLPYFKFIPFLPANDALSKTKSFLKAKGIEVDVCNDVNNENRLTSIERSLFRQRIQNLCKTMKHESAGVRRAVLSHLTDIIRLHRTSFRSFLEIEQVSSMQFLTVLNTEHNTDSAHGMNNPHLNLPSGQISLPLLPKLMFSLLERCVHETDQISREKVAICLGELGAIDPNFLGEYVFDESSYSSKTSGGNLTANDAYHSWRLDQPPWRSFEHKYELILISNQLVVSLKAAPTTQDQHKVAFAIQELLSSLEKYGKSVVTVIDDDTENDDNFHRINSPKKRQMSEWLKGILRNEGVLEIIEPFALTNYKQQNSVPSKKPPFYTQSTSYHGWLSSWCRYMIECSNENDESPWSGLFQSCRAAIRSPSAISVAEFLLPLLVLDGLCFGDEEDKRSILQEMCDVFASSCCQPHNLSEDENAHIATAMLDNDERQKIVNTAFTVIETLEIWAERHEKSQSLQTLSNKKGSKRVGSGDSSNWPLQESLDAIKKLSQAVPFIMRSTSAAEIGMHARSLRYLELDSREKIVRSIYNDVNSSVRLVDNKSLGGTIAPLDTTHLSFAQKLLGDLSDFDSLSAIARESNRAGKNDLLNEAHERLVQGDWYGALQKYEQCLQLRNYDIYETRSLIAERGVLRSLLELGQLESVLNQVRGILSRLEGDNSSQIQLAPFAAEAAWRLGRWALLDELVATKAPKITNEDDRFQIALGKVMLGLQHHSKESVDHALVEARSAVMTSLSSVARESYVRSYPHIVKLHALREIEHAVPALLVKDDSRHDQDSSFAVDERLGKSLSKLASTFSPSNGWNERLALASPEVIGSSSILNVRLGLSRFAKAPGLECEVWLTIGKRARKQGLFHIAEIALTHADVIARALPIGINNLQHQIQFQLSKVKYACGESSSALTMLEQDEIVVNQLLTLTETDLDMRLAEYAKENSNIEGYSAEVFVKRLLKSTEWIIESGLKSGPEVMNRFKLILGLRPLWEKSHFSFARYLDSVLETKVSSLLGNNPNKKRVDDDLMRQWALAVDPKCRGYLLDAMRSYLNTLCYGDKHLLQAMPRLLTIWFDLTSVDTSFVDSQDELDLLVESQMKANKLMRDYRNRVPSFSFYSALPQLISRVGHHNEDTSLLVKKILGRVLSKFPEQAMWPLAWLINSTKSDRASVGMDIFDVAQKYHAQQENMKFHNLLIESKSLFKFLIDLAKYKPKNASTKTFKIKPWKGTIELMDFVPPVQAALSGIFRGPSRRIDYSRSNRQDRDYFSSSVPRMRSFASDIQMMSSKARPKKITAFAVPAGSSLSLSTPNKRSDKKLQPGDIGEMHFLVKQEAKGDLRKDARVQDLNNVINRLLSSSSSSSHGRQRRLLHLRTFSVVCLSEECGILEWVPNTDSFRNIISKSYNPQANPDSIRRNGKRITNFGDVNLRNTFQKCQDLYIKGGNLTGAAKMFEEQMLRDFPPLLYWWFVQHFEEPHAWFEARTKFALSSAIWSAVGHVIGLGDRHSENLLLDVCSGDCVHVDFDCIFDKGLHLPRPEVVPFRLTPNMIDAFGPTGYEGTYRGGLNSAMTTLRENKDTLLSVLEPFLKDPVIDWKRQRSQQRDSSRPNGTLKDENSEAKRSIKVIDGRLRGIYNLSNPNFKKIRRTDRLVHETDDELSHFVPLCVEGQVQKMITEATSNENLVQLYVGWMPWI